MRWLVKWIEKRHTVPGRFPNLGRINEERSVAYDRFARRRINRTNRFLLISDRGSCAVKLCDVYRKRLIVRLRSILQNAQRDLFAQKD